MNIERVYRSGISLLAAGWLIAGVAASPVEPVGLPTVDTMLQWSGIEAQLARIAPTLAEQATLAESSCGASDTKNPVLPSMPSATALLAEAEADTDTDTDTKTDAEHVPHWLLERADVEHLLATARQVLVATLSEQELAHAAEWLSSAAGQLIIKAEHDASSALADTSSEVEPIDQAHRQLRQQQILSLLDTTLVGEFIVSYETEMSALIQLTSICVSESLRGQWQDRQSALRKSVAEWHQQTDAARVDVSFYAQIITMGLLAETELIYKQLDTQTLDAYQMFASSDSGRRYHQALIKATRAALTDLQQQYLHRLHLDMDVDMDMDMDVDVDVD